MQIIDGQTEDLGPLVRLPCAQCESAQWFHLKAHSTCVRLLGFTFARSTAHSLHCATCEYSIDLDEDDARRGINFLPVGAAFKKGNISEADYSAKLSGVGFGFLQEFMEANTTWTCANCGESCPLTCSECWNCATPRAGESEDDSETDVQTPFVDDLVDNTGGPFGTMKL